VGDGSGWWAVGGKGGVAGFMSRLALFVACPMFGFLCALPCRHAIGGWKSGDGTGNGQEDAWSRGYELQDEDEDVAGPHAKRISICWVTKEATWQVSQVAQLATSSQYQYFNFNNTKLTVN